jgi:hypothetical protein
MNKRINFEDNAFILNNRIRVIENTIILDADPDLFLEKTISDMTFIDTCLTFLLDSLSKNEQMIGRNTQFYHLMETESKFMDLLDAISKSKGSISVSEFPIITERIHNFHASSGERQKILQNYIESSDTILQDPNMVSSDELNALLKDF